MSINTLLLYLDKRSLGSERFWEKEKILEKDISNLPYLNLPNQKGISSKPVAIPTLPLGLTTKAPIAIVIRTKH